MAELFNFTGSQNQVRPQSPTVNAVPNTQAADTFKSLSNLFGAAIDANNTLKQKEKAAAVESRRLQSLATAEQVATQKVADNTTFLEESANATVRQQEYNARLQGVGNDKEAARRLTTDYNAESKVAFESLNQTVQLKLNSNYQSGIKKAENNYLSIAKKVDLDDFQRDLSTALPTFLTLPVSVQQESYLEQQEVALVKGMTKSEFGAWFVTSSGNYILGSLDKEGLVNNYDYKSLDAAFIATDNLLALDGKNNKEINAITKKLDTIKNSVDTALNSRLNESITELDRPAYEQYMEIALENGAISEDAALLSEQKYLSKQVSSGEVRNQEAAKIMEATGGNVVLGSIADTKMRNLVATDIQNKITTMLNTEGNNYSTEFLKYQADFNPTEYNKAWKSRKNTSIQNLINIAGNKEASPEEVRSAVDDLNKVRNLAFGASDTESLMELEVASVLTQSGQVSNINDALKIMRSQDGVKLLTTNNTSVKTLKEDLPLDSFGDARRMLSVLSTIMDEDEALSIVEDNYAYSNFDDTDATMSGATVTALKDAGVASNNLEKVEGVMRSRGENAVFSTEVVDQMDSVLGGTNPTLNMVNGGFYYKNDEGNSLYLPLTVEQKATLSNAVTDATANDDVPAGVGIIVADVAQTLAKVLNDGLTGILDEVSALPAIAERGVSTTALNASDISSTIGNVIANANTYAGDRYTGMSEEAAGKKMDDSNIKSATDLAKQYDLDEKRIEGDLVLALAKAGLSIVSRTEATGNFFRGLIKSIGNYVVSPANGSTETTFFDFIGKVAESDHGSQPVKSNDAADVASNSTTFDIGYGHKITGKETNSGKIHGIPFGEGNPLSKEDKRVILKKDMAANLKVARDGSWDRKLADLNSSWASLEERFQLPLTSLSYNVGGTRASSQWTAVLEAAVDKDPVEFAKQLRRQDASRFTEGMDNRVMKEMYAAGFIKSKADYNKYKDVLPLATWKK